MLKFSFVAYYVVAFWLWFTPISWYAHDWVLEFDRLYPIYDWHSILSRVINTLISMTVPSVFGSIIIVALFFISSDMKRLSNLSVAHILAGMQGFATIFGFSIVSGIYSIENSILSAMSAAMLSAAATIITLLGVQKQNQFPWRVTKSNSSLWKWLLK